MPATLETVSPGGLPLPEDIRDLRRADGLEALDRSLASACRERGALRAVVARTAARLVQVRAWERLGFARLSDYAVERLGLSARSAQSLAHVGESLRLRPGLERALVSGRLGWTRVRLLAGLPPEEDDAHWIAYAESVTAATLSKAVRAVDRGSVEAGAADRPQGRSRVFEVCCRPEVRRKWHRARGIASRAAGRMLHVAEAAELIAAEVLSALPTDGPAEDDPPDACVEAGVSWSENGEPLDEETGPGLAENRNSRGGREREAPENAPRAGGDAPHPLTPRLAGLDDADAFELDGRLRQALAREQRFDAGIGGLLARVWERWVHRALGYRTREAYVRDRLGMDPTRARALVRLERAAVLNASFGDAYRTGALSWVKAGALVPLVTSDSLGRFVDLWVGWARRVTVRRLREDVEGALVLQETDPATFWRTGGLPPEARRPDREIGAYRRDRPGDTPGVRSALESPGGTSAAPDGAVGGRAATRAEREIGAFDRISDEDMGRAAPGRAGARGAGGGATAAETCTVRFIGPADVVQLFRAVLCTVRRRLEQDAGRLPTRGEALEAMLDHAFASWGADAAVPKRHRVFARDGWRCAVPGCSSMRNLHDHHIRFRSAGGSDALENRVTLCAFHHLRGVHAEMLRCLGRAPDGLSWQLGIRPGLTPLLAYRSGDVLARTGGATAH